jgi:hypothetical protein
MDSTQNDHSLIFSYRTKGKNTLVRWSGGGLYKLISAYVARDYIKLPPMNLSCSFCRRFGAQGNDKVVTCRSAT